MRAEPSSVRTKRAVDIAPTPMSTMAKKMMPTRRLRRFLRSFWRAWWSRGTTTMDQPTIHGTRERRVSVSLGADAS